MIRPSGKARLYTFSHFIIFHLLKSGPKREGIFRVNRFLDKNTINNNFKVNNCHITTNRQIVVLCQKNSSRQKTEKPFRSHNLKRNTVQ